MAHTGKNTRVILLFIFFASLFAAGQFQRVSSGVMTPVLEAELGLAADVLGLIAGVYFFASACFQLPLGMSIDRFGVRRLAPVMCSVSALGALVYALSESSLTLMVGRMLMGIGYGGAAVMTMVVFARWVRPERYAIMVSWVIAAGNIGGVMATTPLAYAVDSWGRRQSFLVVFVLAVVLAVSAWFIVRDAPPAQGEDTAKQGLDQPPAGLKSSFLGLLFIFRNVELRYLVLMMSVTFGPGMVILGLWGSPYLADVFGLDAIAQGNAMLIAALAGPLGLLAVGPAERFFKSRQQMITICGSLFAGCFFTLAIFGPLSIVLSVICFMGVFLMQAFYILLQTQCRDMFPYHLVGRANTVLNLAGVFGVFFMQGATGLIVHQFPSDHGIAEPMAYRVVFAVVGGLIALAVAIYSRSIRDVAITSMSDHEE